MIVLVAVGIGVGILSGFFGIGGGTILVPILLFLGYKTKTAIGISVVQMVFSSVYGSYLNHKKGTLDVSMIMLIGLGGFIGAFLSGFVASVVPAKVLEWIFFGFVLFALSRLFFKTHPHTNQREIPKLFLVPIGIVIGLFSMLIGVGGSIMLVPILVGFLHIPLKEATSAGLFFVVFSSFSGLVSHALNGHVDYQSGIIVGIASLLGVYLGIALKHKTSNTVAKRLLLVFYVSVLAYLSVRIF